MPTVLTRIARWLVWRRRNNKLIRQPPPKGGPDNSHTAPPPNVNPRGHRVEVFMFIWSHDHNSTLAAQGQDCLRRLSGFAGILAWYRLLGFPQPHENGCVTGTLCE